MMKPKANRKVMQLSFAMLLMTLTSSATATATASLLSIADAPLFVTNAQKANVMIVLDNSNSMDEDATGASAASLVPGGPAGSASPNSKSEIAREVVKDLIATYIGKINMGLMAYQQDNVVLRNIDTSPYDVSYDPSNYDPNFSGIPRNSSTKRFMQNIGGTNVYYNVSLPYYHTGGSVGDSGFCYSTTANAFNNGEIPGGFGAGFGPWDSYRCFNNKVGTSDALVDAGFSGYWGREYTFGPTDSDLAQGITDFGAHIAFEQLGPTWFSNDSPGRGFLHVAIADLDATQAGKLNIKLGTSQFSSNRPINPAFPLQNAGLTPIEGTLLAVKDYFEGNLNAADEGGPRAAPPESCGKNFVTLLTDGLPSIKEDGAIITIPGDGIDDAEDAAEELTKTSIGVTGGNIETYVIGFALPLGFDKATTLDRIAKEGDTKVSYLASDKTSLKAAFDSIFSDILSKSGASSSAATNSTSLNSNSHIYQARFNSGDWSGQLLSTAISTSGVLGAIDWDAGALLNNPTASARKIITYSRDTKDGIPFQWTDIDGLSDKTQRDILDSNGLDVADGQGQKRLNYLRGEASDEKTSSNPSGVFRERKTSKLGDIINSTPFFLGKPDAGHAESEMIGYAAFRTSVNSGSGRVPMIFAGANDGMLHGFNGNTGVEEIAYVPGAIYGELSDLTDPTYGAGSSHRYFVDGSPMVADANLGNDITPVWKTVLAGGFNAGGQGYYALDVTDAATLTESDAASFVLWEFTDEDDADMGYSFNQPTLNRLTNQSAQIARMANGRWALIVGNGYNNTEADGNVSSTGHASLFILFLDGPTGANRSWIEGTDYIKIDTEEGDTTAPNGLSTPRPIDTTGDGRVDVIYAGDLEGNMWKFDVSAVSAASWGTAYGTVGSPIPLYTATDSSGTEQPVTSAPIVTLAPGGNYLVGFATGRYLGLGDVTNTDVQSIYSILDTGFAVVSVSPPRSNLQAQTVSSTPTVAISGLGSVETRITSKNTVDYATEKGWYIDLPDSGERVAFNPILRDGRFVFTTLVPDTGVCSAGGSGWIMELDYLTGGALENSPFIGAPDGTSGIKPPGNGIPNTPTVIGDPDNKKELKIVNESTGNTDVISESVQHRSGRLSWREIR